MFKMIIGYEDYAKKIIEEMRGKKKGIRVIFIRNL